jgi:ligand-binding sensor domain-containing protein
VARQAKLLVGTSKGLIIYKINNRNWKAASVHFEGFPVSLVYIDDRTNTWWVALSHRHWGEKLHCSRSEGRNWTEANVPSFSNYFYQPGKPATLKKIWSMQHAGTDRPGGLWVGTEPGGLFHSHDQGKSFQLVEPLWNHPGRLDTSQWFGAGKDYPFIHSIVLDPRDSDHVYVGVSCAGVFETRDGGNRWEARNRGLVAAYLPNPNAEVGHDPHRILLCPTHPDILWQQNHCGIFRTTDGGKLWDDVSGKDGFPKYGFALAIDDNDPNVAWVIPAHSDERRVPVDLKLSVCATNDAGKNWVSVNRGLPGEYSFDLVLRHSFVKKDNALAFGTNNGNLYVSDDRGGSWQSISQNLPTVNYLAWV